ncbi:MAG: hypothetical protein IJ679_09015 [Lachnospiraceae bacterium]|nr:hypothetical protein [Lachnospiraceae bacterium]
MEQIKINKRIFVIVLAGICTLLLFLINRAIVWTRYIPVEATVKEIEVDNRDNVGNTASMSHIYAVYSYDYDNRHFESRQMLFSHWGHEAGDKKIIRISSEDPNVVFNTYQTKGTIMVVMFCILFEVLLFMIIKKDRLKKDR